MESQQNDWHTIHITDKTGALFFKVTASPMATMSEIRNTTKHIEAIKAGHPVYSKVGIDAESAVLMLDGTPYQTMNDILDDDLLNELLGE